MNVLSRFLKMLGLYRKDDVQKIVKRNFSAASTGRLYSSWTTFNQSADAELRYNLTALRARSRELENNNDYAKKFFRMVKTNIIGRDGIILQSQVMNDSGKPDELARKRIEEAWAKWIKKGICEVSGKYSFRDIQKLVISSVARDGEILVRIIKGFDNDFRFSLQLIEADHLDEKMNETLPNANGNKVKMGVEYDVWNKPVAYHIFNLHPGDVFFGSSFGEKIRVPASEMLHVFHPMRISQTRGIPWMHSAMTRLNMIGAYEEAELVASRIAAAKGGFYEIENADEYTGDAHDEDQPMQEVEPGVFETLPQGWKFKEFDPQHPTTAFKDFVKSILRGISSGLDVSYNYLANDLEGVNYSSIRAGVLDERDVWKDLQKFLIEHFHVPIFEKWLEMALLTQQIALPFSKYEKYAIAKWQPRGWPWVDPSKDIQAKILEINSGLNTGAAIAAEQGKDLEEIYKQLAFEMQLIKKYGLVLPQIQLKPENNKDED